MSDIDLTIEESSQPARNSRDNEMKTIYNANDPGSPQSQSSGTTLLGRAFSPMQPGSQRGSMFTLAGTAIGAGCLALPKVLEFSGITLGILVLCFCALMVRTSTRKLIEAAEHT
jgi:hypothetical protein